MGGSAGGNNAQLLSLLSQYGGAGAAPARAPKPVNGQAIFQDSFSKYMKDQQGGFNGVFAGFGALDRMDRAKARAKNQAAAASPAAPSQANAASPAAASLYWQFPDYTQDWAFTPPAPTPYEYPQPFDTKKYGNPLGKKSVKKNV